MCVPYHDTPNTAFYLSRLLHSLSEQKFVNYELVIDKAGGMARTHNKVIARSKGDIIQMMQMDDYFAHPDALRNIAEGFKPETVWQITACLHDNNGTVGNYHEPKWTDDIYTGNNRLGSISTLSFRRERGLLFEEPLTWLVDVQLYYRLYIKYGLPNLLGTANVVIDTRTDRLSHTLSDKLKKSEIEYLYNLYA